MTSDEAIKNKLKLLKERKAEIEKYFLVNKHECDCEYCLIEDDYDEEEEIELTSELTEIENEIARFSSLKLSEDV